jgi:hypothetical protein
LFSFNFSLFFPIAQRIPKLAFFIKIALFPTYSPTLPYVVRHFPDLGSLKCLF